MQITFDQLAKGKRVWYRYDNYAVCGPYTINGFFGNHEGRHVDLGDRAVLLADDDDFGQLKFYDSNPEHN